MPFGRDEAEFVIALKDGQAAGARVETWPPEVQAFMDQHVARWLDEAKDSRTAHAITVAAPTCISAASEPTQRRNAPARARRLRAAPVGNGCARHRSLPF